MKIGICITKGQKTFSPYEAIKAGILANGDHPVIIEKRTLGILKSCDVSFQIGEYSRIGRVERDFRCRVAEACFSEGIRRVVLDTGYLNKSATDLRTSYFSFGFDGIKGFGDYCNSNSDDKRLRKLDIEIKDWISQDSDNILVGMINDHGWNSALYNNKSWLTAVGDYILENTDKNVWFKKHPNRFQSFVESMNFKKMKKKWPERVFMLDFQTLPYILKSVSSCIVSGSNLSMDAIVNGIPTTSFSPYNIANPVCSSGFDGLNKPHTPDRTQFLQDISYAQWTMSEIESGEAWNHLRPFAQQQSNGLDYYEYSKTFNSHHKLQEQGNIADQQGSAS